MADVNIRLRAKDQTKGVLNNFKSSLTSIGGLLSVGVFAAGMKRAVSLASDLQEATGKFNVVFRGVEDDARSMANELQSAYGMSRRESLQTLSAFQDLLVPMGFARKEASAMAGEISKLAVDLGSFNNVPTADAIRDIQSALVGNVETMKKYGVILTEDTIKQEAYTLGVDRSTKKLSVQQKTLAIQSILFKNSSDAMGDFARTQDSFANSMKILKSQIEDIATAIGAELMPEMGGFVQSLAKHKDTIIRVFQTIIRGFKLFGKIWLAGWKMIGNALRFFWIDPFLKAVSIYLAGVNKLASFLPDKIANSIDLVIGKFEQFRNATSITFTELKDGIVGDFTDIKDFAVQSFTDTGTAIAETTDNVIKPSYEKLIQGAESVAVKNKEVAQAYRMDWELATNAILSLTDTVGATWAVMFNGMVDGTKDMGKQLKQLWRGMFNSLISMIMQALARAVLLQTILAATGLGSASAVIGGGGFGGFLTKALGFQTPEGGSRIIPGSPTTPVPIIAHGGETIGRDGGGGLNIVVNGVLDGAQGAQKIIEVIRNEERRTGMRIA